MSFWSSQRIRVEQGQRQLIDKEKFNPKRLKHGAYELALGRKVLITPDGAIDGPWPTEKKAVRIPPGQFALLYTDESVQIPDDVIAFISLKGRVKFKGLINISGFHVDPGFSGFLKFSVYNASREDVFLNFGEPCFLIWFAALDDRTFDPYDGEHKDQHDFSAEDRERMSETRHSPEALNKRLEKLERHVSLIISVGTVVIIPMIIGLVISVFQRRLAEKVDGLSNRELILATGVAVGVFVLFINSIINGSLKRFVAECERQMRD